MFLFAAVKRGNIRGELFNTSFLLLCHIGQVYGRKVGFSSINSNNDDDDDDDMMTTTTTMMINNNSNGFVSIPK